MAVGIVTPDQISQGVVDVSANVLTEVGKIGNWLQAIGAIIVLWIIFQMISIILARKNHDTIKDLKKNVERLEKKVDLLIGKKR